MISKALEETPAKQEAPGDIEKQEEQKQEYIPTHETEEDQANAEKENQMALEEDQKRKLVQILHIKKNEAMNFSKQLNDPALVYSDSKYRQDIMKMFQVESSKDLTFSQLKEAVSYFEDLAATLKVTYEEKMRELTRKQLDEIKARGTKSLAERARDLVNQGSPVEEKKEPVRDFVGEARKSMLRSSWEKGLPLWPTEILEIGIDPSSVPKERIKTRESGLGVTTEKKQAGLFVDDETPSFLR